MAEKEKKQGSKFLSQLFSSKLFSSEGGGDLAGGFGAAAGALGSIASNYNPGDTSSVESDISTQMGMIPSASSNTALMSEWSNYRPMGRVSLDDIGASDGGQIGMGALQSGLKGAGAGASFGGPVGALIGGGVGLIGGALSGIFGRNKAKDNRDDLNKKIGQANEFVQASFSNRADAINQHQNLNMMSNYFNLGGTLHTGGAQFDRGLTFINEGGSHEENRFGGIQVGQDQMGRPNLLEEGEVKFEGYVFSNSLKADREALELVNLNDSYRDKTFADIAKTLSKESEERPNDPISKKGLYDFMAKLIIAQESYKDKNGLQEDVPANTFPYGGFMPSFDMAVGNQSRRGDERLYVGNEHLYDPQVATPSAAPQAARPQVLIPDIPDHRGSNLFANPSYLNTSGVIPAYNRPGFQASVAPGEEPAGENAFLMDRAHSLRYAPVLGSALSVAGDALGWQNRRDYTHADSLRANRVSASPLGNYMTYNPLDRNYYANQIRSAGAASRSAIANQSGGNRATAMAGILSSDQNMIGQMGALNRQAEEFNLNQRMQVEDFNRATNMFNSEQGLRADMFNSEAEYRAAAERANMKQQIDAAISEARSANLSALFDNMGEIGRESFTRNMINTSPAWRYGTKASGEQGYKGGSYRKGGKLMTKF